MRIFLRKGHSLLYKQQSKFLRGQQNPFFQVRKTIKSKLTVCRQRKRMMDMAGCLQLPPGTERRAAPWPLCFNSSSSHLALGAPKRQFLSLEESRGLRTQIPCVSLHIRPHLYPRVSAPLPFSPTRTYTSVPVLATHFPTCPTYSHERPQMQT